MKRSPIKRSPMKRGQRINKPCPPKTILMHGVIRYADEREKCDKTRAGRIEYNRRIAVMWERQKGFCGLRISPQCPVKITLEQATFEHQDGRGTGGSKRDDRIEIDGVPYNLAACKACNILKGSQSLESIRSIYMTKTLTTLATALLALIMCVGCATKKTTTGTPAPPKISPQKVAALVDIGCNLGKALAPNLSAADNAKVTNGCGALETAVLNWQSGQGTTGTVIQTANDFTAIWTAIGAGSPSLNSKILEIQSAIEAVIVVLSP